MTRWTFRISLCLILGVATTVGVAWGLAWFVSIDDVVDADGTNSVVASIVSLGGSQWLVQSGQSPGTRIVVGIPDVDTMLPFLLERIAQGDAADIPAWSRITENKDARASSVQWPSFSDVARGWPVFAMASGIDAQFVGDYFDRAEYNGCIYAGRPGWASELGHRALPLRPIFPGFVVNTLFYAAMWFGIFFGVAAVRRFIRKKRGRCVKCSYDLRGELDKGCPECGWNREP